MPRIKAINNYHGSEGYKHAGQEWEVSDEEAKGLVKAKHVTLVKEEKAKPVTKEDKEGLQTKDEE